jgi:hypothetical protein
MVAGTEKPLGPRQCTKVLPEEERPERSIQSVSREIVNICDAKNEKAA